MLRRGLIAILILTLVAMVPLPLSACAVTAGLDGPCQCSMPMQRGSMPMPQAPVRNGGPALSCHCIESTAPLPNAVQNTTNPAPAMVTASFAVPTEPRSSFSPAKLSHALATAHLGSPGGRAGICIFLI